MNTTPYQRTVYARVKVVLFKNFVKVKYKGITFKMNTTIVRDYCYQYYYYYCSYFNYYYYYLLLLQLS